MTYEEIMRIGVGEEVPGGFSIAVNATYIGGGTKLLNKDGSTASGGHALDKWEPIVVLDISFSEQVALIQYQAGDKVRQGYIHNSLSNIEYKNLEQNFWKNGSTPETVYYSYTGDGNYPTPIPAHDKAIFLYQVEGRYNIAYTTSKGNYTCAGFVNYSGGITPQITDGRRVAGGKGTSSDNNIVAGGIVADGRTYPVNATSQENQTLTDVKGNPTGHSVSVGDELTVLDISYSRQRALVQYPAGSDIRQGYIVNDPRFIVYKNPYEWVNGSSTEVVYSDIECTKEFGTINPYESATVLYRKDNKTMVVYDAPDTVHGGTGMQNKNGFVHFAGNTPQSTPSAGQLLDRSFNGNVERIPYGTSPLGHPLNVYKIGSGSNVLFANFAMHGFEDDWNHDGTALVTIANNLIEKFSATGDLHGWTVYVNPCANPDGTFNGITNDGPGRCTVFSRIDMNRCFPVDFRSLYNSRNYTGNTPLGAPEAKDLRDKVLQIHKDHNIDEGHKMVVVDFHGWMGFTQGNSEVAKYFVGKFGYNNNDFNAPGFFATWANSLSNTKGMLLEYPKKTRSIKECLDSNYVGKTYDAFMDLFTNESGQGAGTSNNEIENGSTGNKVKEVQQDLRGLGYAINTIDGVFGTETEEAVKTFQKDNGLYVDGIVGNSTMTNIKEKVEYVQTLLAQAGYTFGSIDGYFGDSTKDAVERFQRDAKLYIDGIVGSITLAKIKKCAENAAHKGDPIGPDVSYQTVGQVNDKASSVHVRKGPSTANDVITSVTTGELLMIIGKTQPEGESLAWYEIELNGQELYIRSDFVNIVSETKMQEEGTVASTSTDYAHVRYLPGTGSECATLDTLYNGTKVEILGKLQPQGQSLPWYRVKYAVKDGSTKIGFIRTDLVRDSGVITPDTNPSDIQNPKYVQIAKALGFNVNTSLRNGIISTIKGSHNIYFQGEAIEINEEINTTYAAKIVNGQIVNARKSIDYLGIPFGNSGIKAIASTLNNGYIECKISEGSISFKIKDSNYSRILILSLQCISNIQEWKDFAKEISPFTQAESGLVDALDTVVVKTTVIVAVFAFTMIMLDGGRIANASEITEVGEEAQAFSENSPLYLKEGVERLKGYIEDLTVKLDTRVNPKELNPMFQSELEKAKERLETLANDLEDGFSRKLFKRIKVISIVKDLENIDSEEYVGVGTSGTGVPNPNIGNYTGNLAEEELYDNSINTLTDDWVKTTYENSKEKYQKLNISLEQLIEEMGKLRAMIGKVRGMINEAGGGISFKGWKLENCAEIWAIRDGIMNGIKVENMVMKTVQFKDFLFKEPCDNCIITIFKFVLSGRLLK